MESAFITQVIDKGHRVKEFECSRPQLTDYLKRFARQTTSKGGARTFVATAEDDPTLVIGFYSLVASEISAAQASAELKKGLGNYPLPGFRLARLAVDKRFEGLGLGGRLLLDAGFRCLAAATQVGSKAMFIDAKDDTAANFYRRFGATSLPDSPLVLVWPLAMIEEAVRQPIVEDDFGQKLLAKSGTLPSETGLVIED